jgi:hypothetical protein
MEIYCSNCTSLGNKPTVIAKSYGSTLKIRSKSIRYDSLLNKTVAQCNYCRSFIDIPISMNLIPEPDKFVVKSDKKLIIKE